MLTSNIIPRWSAPTKLINPLLAFKALTFNYNLVIWFLRRIGGIHRRTPRKILDARQVGKSGQPDTMPCNGRLSASQQR
jgi:hypothetical protein